MIGNKFITRAELPTFIKRSGDNGNLSINGLIIKPNGYIIGVPKNLLVRYDSVGNINTGLDTLHSYTMAADVLHTNNDYLEVKFGYKFASNNNDKRIKLTIDGQTINDTGLFDQDAGAAAYYLTIIRVSATQVRVLISFFWNFFTIDSTTLILGGNGIFATDDLLITVSDLNANTIIIKSEAEATATDDVIQNLSKIDACQVT